MPNNILKVGDIVSIPMPDGKNYNGEVLYVNEHLLDPRMKYEVAFDDLEIVMFYSEKMMRKMLNAK